MQTNLAREALLERRQVISDTTLLWDKLSLEQKFAASSLTQLGYDLIFIRKSKTSRLAFLAYQEKMATITEEGEINISPQVTLRP